MVVLVFLIQLLPLINAAVDGVTFNPATPAGAVNVNSAIPSLQVEAQDVGITDAGDIGCNGGACTVYLTVQDTNTNDLVGTYYATATSGVATFNDLQVDSPGTFKITATIPNQATADWPNLTINDAAQYLEFSVQPVNETPDQICKNTVQVTAKGYDGNTLTSFTGSVTLSVTDNQVNMTDETATAVSGVASFSSCTAVAPKDTIITLKASANNVQSAYSNQVTISEAPPAYAEFDINQQLEWNVDTDMSFTGKLYDQWGQLVEDGGNTIVLNSKSGTSLNSATASVTGSALSVSTARLSTDGPGSHELDWQCGSCPSWTAADTITITVVNPAALVVSFPEPLYAGWANKYCEMELNQDPGTNVVVTISGGSPITLASQPTSHTFNSGNYNTKTKIYFNLADDTADYDGSLTFSMTSSAAEFNGIASYTYNGQATNGDLTVPVIVDARVVIQSATSLLDGGTGTLSVELTKQPTADVTITASTTFSNIQLTKPSHTFTSSSWAASTVNFSANGSVDCTGDLMSGEVTFTTSSTDSRYDNADATWVPSTQKSSVTMLCSEIKLIQIAMTTDPSVVAGTQVEYEMSLLSEPTDDVVITITVDSDTTLDSSSPLTFRTNNYSTTQTVQVTPGLRSSGVEFLSFISTVKNEVTSTSDTLYTGQVEYLDITVQNYCADGLWNWPGSNSCTVMPAGFKLDGGKAVPCPEGEYNTGNGQTCAPCGSGKYCPDGKSEENCPTGYYSTGSQRYCTACPPGSSCTTSAATPCSAGTYSVGLQTTCTNCPAGKYCPSKSQGIELDCPPGTYSAADASECTVWAAGSECSPTAESGCSSGEYSAAGQPACSNCGEGFTCSSGGSSDYDDPIFDKCRFGFYGSTTCIVCPAGSYCTATSATQCGSDTYSLEGQEYCNTCPYGYTQSSDGEGVCVSTNDGEDVSGSCGSGFWSAGSSGICKACVSGYSCDSSDTPTPNGNECQTGLVCEYSIESGSGRMESRICPQGTYQDETGGMFCKQCPAGAYCAANSKDTSSPCGEGHYCPPGSVDANQIPCPPGFYLNTTGAKSVGECLQCTDTKYCPIGSTDVTDCPDGHICRVGQGTSVPCPAGTYTPDGIDCSALCPVGQFCVEGTKDPENCPRGTFNPNQGGGQAANCERCPPGYFCKDEGMSVGVDPGQICPAGYYCPAGTEFQDEFPCPAGTWSASTGLFTPDMCTECGEGKACPNTEETCSDDESRCYHLAKCRVTCIQGETECLNTNYGIQCQSGEIPCVEDSANQCPKGATVELACAPGHFCPKGTEAETQWPCPPGTYGNGSTDLKNEGECVPCTEMNACPLGSDTVTPCADGYYCPASTEYTTQFPCPAGTYHDVGATTNLKIDTECESCPAGKFCPSGITTPIACPDGTYSDIPGAKSLDPDDSVYCKPCPAGKKCTVVTGTINPEACVAGTYSAEGDVGECKQCILGHHCSDGTNGTSETTMLTDNVCDAGYLCPAGSGNPAFPDASYACVAGHYCLQGATVAIPCPPGTRRLTTGAAAESDCQNTPAGYWDDSEGQDEDVTQASVSPGDDNECQPGYYCPEGSTSGEQEPCPAGTIQSSTAIGDPDQCLECPITKYCLEAESTGQDCTAGHYCPAGVSEPIPCPAGSFLASADAPIGVETDCTACSPGKYCDEAGLTVVSGDCDAGFFCSSGSSTSTPFRDTWGDICSTAGYCEEGSDAPAPCNDGTFVNFEGAKSAAECIQCPPGNFCAQANSNDNQPLPCTEGYYCSGGAAVGTQHDATAGYYAPAGSIAMLPCPPGTYTGAANGISCDSCPEGKYCKQDDPGTPTSTPANCPRGHYCELGTATPKPCPKGTYRATEEAKSASECTDCDTGSYCQQEGLETVSGTCGDGYFCTTKAWSQYPKTVVAGEYGICPAGSWCTAGTGPTACVAGTYNPSKGGADINACLQCDAGSFCAAPVSGGPTAPDVTGCQQGYYCPEGSLTNTGHLDGDLTDKICSVGHYCPTGSAAEIKCPPGTYVNATQQHECLTCPKGFYCPIGTSDYTANPCPKGFWCEDGTTHEREFPCPIGTFNNQTQQETETDACTPCTQGYFCNVLGAQKVSGDCAEGFYCVTGSITPKPTVSVYGGRCLQGQFCPINSFEPTPCTAGHYCNAEELAAVIQKSVTADNSDPDLCSPGYYCISGATSGSKSKRPLGLDSTEGDICPRGHYCEEGTTTGPTACLAGNYLPYEGASAASECIECIPGYYCPTDGLAVPTLQCPDGKFCPAGTTLLTDASDCTIGHYCPLGSFEEIPCEEGTYQDEPNKSSCKTCTAGNYCEDGANSQTPCSPGFYCPDETRYETEFPCPPGTYNPDASAKMSDYTDAAAGGIGCQPCPAGKFCSEAGQAAVGGDCEGGWFCSGSSVGPKPVDSGTGQLCTRGTFCASGEATGPTDCTGGKYCDRDELSVESGLCTAGYYCTLNAITLYPAESADGGNMCPTGHFCPEESTAEQDCPLGSYNPAVGLAAQTDCEKCPRGSYCDELGLTNVKGDCLQGYYCDLESQTNNANECTKAHSCPTGSFEPLPCKMGEYQDELGKEVCKECTDSNYCDKQTENPSPCPVGHYCPAGTMFDEQYPCLTGNFQDDPGQSTCKGCTAGSYCDYGASTDSTNCPAYHYCIVGVSQTISYPQLCEPGTYHDTGAQADGLDSAGACTSCPAGSYCIDGRVSGDCAPGYLCHGGSDTPTPVRATTTGEPCPIGNYCGAAALAATPCPAGTTRTLTGGRQESDCAACPPGFVCAAAGGTPTACARGNWCHDGISTPCIVSTYSTATTATTQETCRPCPAGYICTDEGVSDYNQDKYKCTVGYYCTEGAKDIIACPPGTYSFAEDAKSIDDCITCPKGNQCSGGSRIDGCLPGTYCEGGIARAKKTPVGYYSGVNATSPIICPKGFYCPKYDFYDLDQYVNATEPPIACPTGYYCALGSFEPQVCGPGYVTDSKQYACDICPAGSYSIGQPSVLTCTTCWAGYLCSAGAIRPDPTDLTYHRGVICPVGHYCPAGATAAIACPVATYQPLTGAADATACLLCPSDEYNPDEGQAKCLPCGSNAESDEGSITCDCLGDHRGYGKHDGSCRCKPLYQFTSETLVLQEDDSDTNCYPIVYDRCEKRQERDANGDCKDREDCSAQCDGGDGQFMPGTGFCQCDDVRPLEAHCNKSCRDSALKVKLLADGTAEVTDPTQTRNNVEILSIQDIPGYYGLIECTENDCSTYSIDMTAESGPNAKYGLGSILTTEYDRIKAAEAEAAETSTSSNRRRLQDDADSTDTDSTTTTTGTDNEIYNPVICINKGMSIIWSIPNQKNFPVYDKDSLVNTNNNFDYSAFVELKRMVESDSTTISMFAFTFIDDGNYDIVDNDDNGRHTIIAVMGGAEQCPDPDTPLMTRTEASVVTLGVATSDDLILNPDWLLISMLIVSAIILLIILFVLLYFFFRRAWVPVKGESIAYRELQKTTDVVALVKPEDEDAPDEAYGINDDIDPTIFSDLHDKLKNQNVNIDAGFSKQTAEQNEALNKLLEQSNRLHSLLDQKIAYGKMGIEALLQGIDSETESDLSDTQSQIDGAIPTDAIGNPIIEEQGPLFGNELMEENERTEAATSKLHQDIQESQGLLEKDKEELINEFNANMGRLNGVLEGDKNRYDNTLQKRIEDRERRRREAARKAEENESKRNDLIAAQANEVENHYLAKAEEQKVIDEEYRQEMIDLQKEIRRETDEKLEDLRANLQSDLAGARSKEEASAILKANEIAAKRIEDQIAGNRAKKEEELMKKLAERRAAKKNQSARRHEEGEDALKQKHDEQIRELDANRARLNHEGLETAKNIIQTQIVSEMQEDEHIQDMVDHVCSTQLAEISDFDSQCEHEDMEAAEQEREEELNAYDDAKGELEEKQKERQEQKAALETAMSESDNAGDKEKLMAEMAKLDNAISENELQQKKKINDKIAERKRARALRNQERKAKQAIERVEIEEKHIEERVQVQTENELEKLEAVLSTSNFNAIEAASLIRQVLEDKHDRELQDLAARKNARLQERQTALIQDGMATKALKLQQARDKYKDQKYDIKHSEDSPEIKEKQLVVLKSHEKDELDRIEYEFLTQLNVDQENSAREIEDEYKDKFLCLVDQHMLEIRETLLKINTQDGALIDAHLADAEQEASRFKGDIELDYLERLKELEDRRLNIKLRQRERELEIDALEQEIQNLEQQNKERAEIEANKQKMLDRQAKLLDELESRGIGQEEMQRMLEEHAIQMNAWEAQIEEERRLQQERLQERMAAKMERNQNKIKAEIAVYKEDNLKIRKAAEEEEKAGLKTKYDSGIQMKLTWPETIIPTELKRDRYMYGDDEGILELIEHKVRNCEEIVIDVDTTHMEDMMKAIEEVQNSLKG